jgi:FkbM family methyltransferase
MKAILKLLVVICRTTPSFRGKWRLEAWLEKNKEKYSDLGPVTYRVKGHKYKVYPQTNFHLYMYGPKKKNISIVPLISKFAKPGSTVIDVGAHSGYFTICLSEAVGTSGKVYAFEASPVIYAELRETVDSNGLVNVEAINKAVSDKLGHINFFLAPNWKSEVSSMRPREGGSTVLDAVALDNVIPHTHAVSFVKIDVEGAEMKVLKGMTETIQRDHPTMVIEVSDTWLKELGSSSAEVFDFLRLHGYKIFAVGEQECIEVIDPPTKQIDALCIHNAQ